MILVDQLDISTKLRYKGALDYPFFSFGFHMMSFSIIGHWLPSKDIAFTPAELSQITSQFRETVVVVQDPHTGAVGISTEGDWAAEGYPVLAVIPALYPEWLGSRGFTEEHGVQYPYVCGAMANGIGSTDLVTAIVRAGGMGFFGAAGLSPRKVSEALDRLEQNLGKDSLGWGSNLIHSPNEPELEEAIADLYIRREIRRVSAAAYMKLSPAILRYALTGLSQDERGKIHRQNYVFAKISRPEVAQHFMSPAPEAMVTALLERELITPEEARISQLVPVAEDIIIESDSGGHTDNQALSALFPTIANLREKIAQEQKYARSIRLGAAGGLGAPQAVASAFSLGADFVLTGSVNQGCIESGLSKIGKELLANVNLADVMMAPAADMFELGVEVQVLKRGSMFGVRAKKLYDLYRKYDSIMEIPITDLRSLEKSILKKRWRDAWADTAQYWSDRDPNELRRAMAEPKHQMALLFRSYLGQSSKWSIQGVMERKMDFQIWCGPAMGAFNSWAKGSFLEDPANREVEQVARNLLEGACMITRAQQLRSCGVPVPSEAFLYRPQYLQGDE